jgi:hypothetical protein
MLDISKKDRTNNQSQIISPSTIYIMAMEKVNLETIGASSPVPALVKNFKSISSYTPYTCPSMGMTAAMFFSKNAWPKLREEQCIMFLEPKKIARDSKRSTQPRPSPAPVPAVQVHGIKIAYGTHTTPPSGAANPTHISGSTIRFPYLIPLHLIHVHQQRRMLMHHLPYSPLSIVGRHFAHVMSSMILSNMWPPLLAY